LLLYPNTLLFKLNSSAKSRSSNYFISIGASLHFLFCSLVFRLIRSLLGCFKKQTRDNYRNSGSMTIDKDRIKPRSCTPGQRKCDVVTSIQTNLPRDGDVEELHGDPTVGPRPKVWTRGKKWKKWCRRWRAVEARMRSRRR